ncbi:hypothetical protein MKEN_00404100 [Mycena kentingensis (nom. inval.)]|nr:hypothetical protein MKEN_00404100 [Mycena kentingensis (nom. inval.)]
MPSCPFTGPLCNKKPKGTTALQLHLLSCPAKKAAHTQNVAVVTAHAESVQAEAAAAEAAAQAIVDLPMRDPTPPPVPEFWDGSGRPKRSTRARQLPARYRDIVPDLPPVAETQPAPADDPPQPDDPELEPDMRFPSPGPAPTPSFYRTRPNFEGLYKTYPCRPTHDPDENATLASRCLTSELAQPEQEQLTVPAHPAYFPFSSYSSAWLMSWFLENTTLTLQSLRRLVDKVFRRRTFKLSELLEDFDPQREWDRLERAERDFADDLPRGWKTGEVTIKLPPPPGRKMSEADAPSVTVKGIAYRPLLDILEEAVKNKSFQFFHTTPFFLRQDPTYDPDSPDEIIDDADPELDQFGIPHLPPGHDDVYGEFYTSEEMMRLHNRLPPRAPDGPEHVVAAYFFWSDGTNLGQWGSASLWPKYTGFGNVSKYIRCKPTAHACYHSAYFPSVPEWVKDEYKKQFNVKNVSAETMAHLKRELMHAVWEQLLLTPEFIHAYIHGHPITCWDDILRLFFPRLSIYGADYLEKILLALIRSNGGCPCIHCLVPKDLVHELGRHNDKRRREVNARQDSPALHRAVKRAREFIFDLGYSIKSPRVEGLLKEFSWVPTRNAFSKIREEADPTFNLYDMFVPDVLHEMELGVMKAVLIHVLRVLDATSKQLGELDKRL